MTSCGKIYHRRLFDDISFPRGRYREDEFTTYKLWFKADKVYYTPKKLYFYYQRSTSILHQPNAKKETDYYDALLERHDYFNRKKVSKDILQLDTDFCVTQLYNVLFLDDSVPDSRKRYYISQYKLLYDQSKIKMKLNRFFFMRFMPRLFERAWKIKKGRLIAGKW